MQMHQPVEELRPRTTGRTRKAPPKIDSRANEMKSIAAQQLGKKQIESLRTAVVKGLDERTKLNAKTVAKSINKNRETI